MRISLYHRFCHPNLVEAMVYCFGMADAHAEKVTQALANQFRQIATAYLKRLSKQPSASEVISDV